MGAFSIFHVLGVGAVAILATRTAAILETARTLDLRAWKARPRMIPRLSSGMSSIHWRWRHWCIGPTFPEHTKFFRSTPASWRTGEGLPSIASTWAQVVANTVGCTCSVFPRTPRTGRPVGEYGEMLFRLHVHLPMKYILFSTTRSSSKWQKGRRRTSGFLSSLSTWVPTPVRSFSATSLSARWSTALWDRCFNLGRSSYQKLPSNSRTRSQSRSHSSTRTSRFRTLLTSTSSAASVQRAISVSLTL